jgi:selenide, water dikinase
VAAGLVHPKNLRRNASAQAGDVLILTKPLGIGVMTTAVKKGKLSDEGYAQVLAVMTQRNQIGSVLAENSAVHAMTDVTGFGLLGHLLEVCRGAGLKAILDPEKIPILPEAKKLARAGIFPGAAGRNWQGYQHDISAQGFQEWEQLLLADPQTSGGLLLAVKAEQAADILTQIHQAGYAQAAVIGSCVKGIPGIQLTR